MFLNKNANHILIYLLTLSMFFSGGSSLVNEFILSSISTMILGNSLEQFSLTIGLMLFAMGIGGFSQKFVNDNYLIQKFIILEIILALVGSYAPIAMYSAFAYIPNHFQLINYLSIFSIGFLIGFEIPFIIRMAEKYSPDLKKNLSTIFSADYIGAFVGTLIWVYFLMTTFPFTESSFIVSGSNLFVAIITFIFFIFNEKKIEANSIDLEIKLLKDSLDTVNSSLYEKINNDIIELEKLKITILNSNKSKIIFIFPILLLIVVITIFYGYLNNRNWNISLEQKLYKDPIIFQTTTKYQHIVVTDNKKLEETRLYINGNVQFSSKDEKRYHDLLVHPVMNLANKIENVLVLGGGDGLAVRELKKYKDIKNITLIDLDKGMIDFSKNNPIMKNLNNNAFENINLVDTDSFISSNGVEEVLIKDEKEIHSVALVDIINVDAGKFLQQIENIKWDVIIIDLPDPSVIELVKLYSKEFYLSLTNVMNSDAILAIQSTSPYHAKESYLCIQRTLEAAGIKTLPYRYNIPSFGDWGWFIGWKNDISKEEMLNKINNLNSFSVETEFITPEVFKSSLIFGKGELDTNDKRINTWMNPVLLDIYTKNSWLNY
jgi:spermidine synthase